MSEKEYIDLGIMNGWAEPPDLYKKCKEQNHKLEVINKGRCWNKYICHKCKIYFEVDSSD